MRQQGHCRQSDNILFPHRPSSSEHYYCPKVMRRSKSSMDCWHQKSVQNICILLLLFIPGFVTGLQCYECLSLACESRQICESIKDTISDTFVRNSHYIHFDPRVVCPSPNVPTNSSEWSEVVYNCTRSDSVCLEAPIEVITSFNGLRDGKKLEVGMMMSSWGFVRGCANRRALRELPRSISVRRFTMANETLKYKSTDEYNVDKIHFHEVYVDHGTQNSTKCYQDACNNRRKHRVRSGGSTIINHFSRNLQVSCNCVLFLYLYLLSTIFNNC